MNECCQNIKYTKVMMLTNCGCILTVQNNVDVTVQRKA